jgi:hypothetical protein
VFVFMCSRHYHLSEQLLSDISGEMRMSEEETRREFMERIYEAICRD